MLPPRVSEVFFLKRFTFLNVVLVKLVSFVGFIIDLYVHSVPFDCLVHG